MHISAWHIVLIALCIRSGFCNVSITCSIFRFTYRKFKPEAKISKKIRLNIVLPVLNEETTINKSMRHICSVMPWSSRLFVVGNVVERNNSGINPTLEAASNASADLANAIVLEYPFFDGRRPHQINFALQHFNGDPQQTWVLMIDVDSHFTANAVSDIINAINCGHKIIHQPALFLGNFYRLSLPQRGHAIYQSRWTLAHEIRRICTHNYTGCFISHVVGHGLCIQLEAIAALGNLPTESILEDLHLGFYAAALMKKVHVLPSFEISDCPENWWEGLVQQFRWASGAQQYPFYFYMFLKRFPRPPWTTAVRALIVAIHGTVSSVAWNLTSYLVIAAIFSAAQGDYFAIVFLTLYFLEFQQCAIWFRSLNFIRRIDVVITPFYVLLELAKHSFPANLALINLLGRLNLKFAKATHKGTDL